MSRTRFPLNVHSEISMANEGVSFRTKKSILIVALIFLTGIITWTITQMLKDTPLQIVGGLVGIIIGVMVSVFVYNHFFVNRNVEQFEDSKSNKIFRFFRISVTTSFDAKEIDGIECSRYLSGQYIIALKIAIGNITTPGEQLSEMFFDQLLHLCHKQKINMKIFTTSDDWETSEIHLSYLKRLSKLHDDKLRTTLSKIDAFQSEKFKDSSVVRICFLFYVQNNKMQTLKAVIQFVEAWKRQNIKLATIRECTWVSRLDLVKLVCDYLGTSMIDVSPLADKEKRVVLDIRKRLRPYASESFFLQEGNQHVIIDTNASYLRTGKLSKTKGGKG